MKKKIKKITLKQILLSIGFVILFGLIGCFQFTEMRLELSLLTHSSTWFEIGYRSTIATVTSILVLSMLYDYYIIQDDYTNQVNIFNTLTKVINDDFDPYIDKRNRETKLDTFTKSLKVKRAKLSKRAKTLITLGKNVKELDNIKKELNEIETLLRDTNIDNIDDIQCEYDEINTLLFIDANTYSNDSDVKLVGSYSKLSAKFIISSIIGSLFISIIIGMWAFGFKTDGFNIDFVIGIIIDISLILFNVLKSFLQSGNIFYTAVTAPLMKRNKILKEYRCESAGISPITLNQFLDGLNVKEDEGEVNE